MRVILRGRIGSKKGKLNGAEKLVKRESEEMGKFVEAAFEVAFDDESE